MLPGSLSSPRNVFWEAFTSEKVEGPPSVTIDTSAFCKALDGS